LKFNPPTIKGKGMSPAGGDSMKIDFSKQPQDVNMRSDGGKDDLECDVPDETKDEQMSLTQKIERIEIVSSDNSKK